VILSWAAIPSAFLQTPAQRQRAVLVGVLRRQSYISGRPGRILSASLRVNRATTDARAGIVDRVNDRRTCATDAKLADALPA